MSDAVLFRSHVQSVEDLRGPAGKLEAVLNTGRADALYAAVVAHPHPPSGGTMHTKAVYHAMKAFTHFGIPVLRFNFRSAGRSDGEHDEGRGEVDDVRAAVDWLERRFGLPVLFAGFSFGSNVGLRACCGDVRVRGLVGLGLPVRAAGRDYTYGFLPACGARRNSSSRVTTTSSARAVCWKPRWSPLLRRNASCGSKAPIIFLRVCRDRLRRSWRRCR